MDGQQRWIGVASIVLSATAFGAMAIFARLAEAGGVAVTAVLFLRFAIAGLTMSLIMVLGRRRWPDRRQALVLAGMGGLGYFGQSLAFFTALQHASAGLVALLLYLYPFLVAVGSAVFLGERLTRARRLAIAAALAGTVLTIGDGGGGSVAGIAWGLAAALIYSVYILVGSRIPGDTDPLGSATVVMLAAAGAFALLAGVQAPAWPQTPTAWAAVVAIALVSTVVAMVAFFVGLQRLGASDAATLSTLEPVVTFVLAALFLGEAVRWNQVLGGAVVLVAVVWLARQPRRLSPDA